MLALYNQGDTMMMDMGIWLVVLALCGIVIWRLVAGMLRSGYEPVWLQTIMVVGTYGWWVLVLLEGLFGITIEEFGTLEILHIALSPFLMPAIAALTSKHRDESIETALVYAGAVVYTPALIIIAVCALWVSVVWK
jgi:hypothetical protein